MLITDIFFSNGGLGLLAFFVFVWLVVTSILSLLSGWFLLMRRFPDHPTEKSLITLKGQSGTMGIGVSMNRVLRISATPMGLRIGIPKMCGPFCRDFLVPWSAIHVSRKRSFLWPCAELTFGLDNGRLKIDSHVADRIWRVVPENWPENGSPPEPETRVRIFVDIFRWGLVVTGLASAFFFFVPRFMGADDGPSPLVAIL